MIPYRKPSKIVLRYRAVRWELAHFMRTRSLLLCAELTLRGVPHKRDGDRVMVYVEGLWFDVIAWAYDDGYEDHLWLVDHPHPDLWSIEFATHQIGHRHGFCFPVGELSDMWAQFQNAHPETVWDGPISVE